jgi:hypothetical protein
MNMATNTTNYNLVKPAYADTADIADINGNMDVIDGQMKTNANGVSSNATAISNVQDGLAIVATGNTHAAIPAESFVYIKSHGTLADGLYKNTSGSTIAQNATLSSSNVTADSTGGLNALASDIATLNSKLPTETLTGSNAITTSHTLTSASLVRVGNIVLVNAAIKLTSNVSAWSNFATINGSYKPANPCRGYGDKINAVTLFYVGVQGNIQIITSGGQSGETIVLTAVYSLV